MESDFVDLHIHSCFSDGTMTPDEIISQAKQNHIRTISITDHNALMAYNAVKASGHEKVNLLPGVELDAGYGDHVYHILGYGIDPLHRGLMDACEYNRQQQEQLNRKAIERMSQDENTVAVDEYNQYTYDPQGGGWKLLHYLLDKKLTKTLMDGRFVYGRYGLSPVDAGFVSLADAVAVIHAAGGVAVLAHPKETIKAPVDSRDFAHLIKEMTDEGIQGLECFHPVHSFFEEEFLLRLCREKDLLISGGTDCHGDFFSIAKQKIGGQFVPYGQVSKLLDLCIC